MKKLLEMILTVTVLAVGAYLGTAMLVTMFDPACGPDGYSQKACIEEFNNDLINLVSR